MCDMQVVELLRDGRDVVLLFLACNFPPIQQTYLSFDDCLEDKREKLSELFFAVLYTTVVHNDKHIPEQFLKLNVSLGVVFVFVHLFRFSILCVFLV